MARPTVLPKPDMVRKAAERIIESKINHTNPDIDFYTEKIVVDRSGDPTRVTGSLLDEMRECLRAVQVQCGAEVTEENRTGGVRRYRHIYPIICIAKLSNTDVQQGRQLDTLKEEMVDDLKTALGRDAYIKAAGAELGFPVEPGVAGAMSCIDHHIASVRMIEEISHPYIAFVVDAEFRYDRAV